MIGLDAVPRPFEPGDAARVVRMFSRLTPDTVHKRFFTVSAELDGPLLRALIDVDHQRHEALVLPVGDEVVALASYHVRGDNPTVADVAVLVEDGWQHHGLGQRMVRHLGRLAGSRGLASFHADVLPDNRPVVELIHRTNRAPQSHFTGGELSFDLPLHPAA